MKHPSAPKPKSAQGSTNVQKALHLAGKGARFDYDLSGPASQLLWPDIVKKMRRRRCLRLGHLQCVWVVETERGRARFGFG